MPICKLAAGLAFACLTFAQTAPQLTPHNVKVDSLEYKGKRAIKLVESGDVGNGEAYAIVNGATFHNGEIELELAGQPAGGAGVAARGFIGIAFRMKDGKYEYIYLRPTNGRADDQLRRNHAVQYESIPDFPWDRLRREQPGVYESYTDLEVGAWTKMKIEVAGRSARLYVNGATQPCLIVNDLKLGETRGQVGLWAHIATNAYFSNLKITQTN